MAGGAKQPRFSRVPPACLAEGRCSVVNHMRRSGPLARSEVAVLDGSILFFSHFREHWG